MSMVFSRETTRLNRLEKELILEMSEIIKLEKKLNAPSFELSYRKLEVAFELFKKYQDEENRKFVNKGEYNDKSKEEFFIKTRDQARLIERVGRKTIARFADKKEIYRVYYILGQLNTDLNKFEKAKDYLAKGLASTPSEDEALKEKYSNMSIYADILFNDKKFLEASKLYAILIKRDDHFAINKFKYNYAFCLYNLGRFDEALFYITQVSLTKGNNKYDLSMEAMNQSYIFFEGANKFSEARDFYFKHKPSLLWDFTKHLLVKGFHDEGIKTFNILLKSSKDDLIKIIDYQMKFLQIIKDNRKFETFKNILPMISKSFQGADSTSKEEIRVFLLNTLADLQSQYKTKDGVRDSELFRKMANLAKEIILFMIREDRALAGDYYFLLGDYFYELKLFKNALGAYEKSFENKSRATGRLKSGKPQIDIIVSLYSSKRIVSTMEKRKRVYLERIKLHPLDSKNIPLLKEVFDINITLRNFSGAQNILLSLKNVYSVSNSIIIANALQLFNIYIEIRDEKRMLSLLNELKKNKVKLPPKSLGKIVNTIEQIEFDDAVKLLEGKQFEAAYIKFKKVRSSANNLQIKKDAHYNMAVSLYGLKKLDNAFKVMLAWSKKFGFQKLVFFNNILKDYGDSGNYLNQYKKAEILLAGTCKNNIREKSTYLSLIVNYELAFLSKSKVLSTLKKYRSCITKNTVDSNLLVLIDNFELKDLQLIESNWTFLVNYKKTRVALREFVKYAYILTWKNYELPYLNSLAKKVAKSDSRFRMIMKSEINGTQILKQILSYSIIEFSFPPQLYKSQVIKTLDDLGQLEQMLGKALRLNSSYQYKNVIGAVIKKYTEVIKKLINFNPKIANSETRKGFKRSLDELVAGLLEKRESLMSEYKKVATNSDFLSLRNNELYDVSFNPYLIYPLSQEGNK